jgi:hypothetical protein
MQVADPIFIPHGGVSGAERDQSRKRLLESLRAVVEVAAAGALGSGHR